MNLHVGYGADGRAIRLKPEERKTHMHVIGSSGSGKSKFLEWMMRGDLENRQGFCLIDPHGTLYQDVVNYCAHDGRNNNVILLNLSSPDKLIRFNPSHKSGSAHLTV